MTADELVALIPANWRAAVEVTLAPADLERLARRLTNEPRVVPTEREAWFRALDATPLADVRAVILGQDPYKNPKLADGLAFSVPAGTGRVPPSLRRILNEAQAVATIAAGRTSLLPWAQRGVLLLNTALTVPKGQSGGHISCWRPVTDAILRAVAAQRRCLAFMPWGAQAAAAIARVGIVDGDRHIVDASVHPMQRARKFIGSDPFGRANDRLRDLRLEPIDWSLDQADPDSASVTALLDAIPGAFERAQQGIGDVSAGRVQDSRSARAATSP